MLILENMQLVVAAALCYGSSITGALRLHPRGEQPISVDPRSSTGGDVAGYLDALEDALTMPIPGKFGRGAHGNGTAGRVPFALFEVGCGEEYCRDMITSLKSLALQCRAGGRWDAWCVVDEACGNLLDQELPLGNMTCNRLPIQELLSAGAVIDLPHHCASARLWVPRVLMNLADYKHLLYVDADTIVTKSIQPVLQAVEAQGAAAFSMAEVTDSGACPGYGWYNEDEVRRTIKAGVNGYNTGVLGINVQLWHQAGITDKILGIVQEARQGKVRLELGDQDILNLIARGNSSLLRQLPCEFNVRVISCCRDELGYRTPFVLHGTRHIFDLEWKEHHDVLVRQLHAMLSEWSEEQRSAMSLWEASGLNISSFFS